MAEWIRRREGRMFPGVIRCTCGSEVILSDPMANECTCGRDYNSSGQLLAPRAQWGEETGETADQIVNWRQRDGDWNPREWGLE